MSWHCGWLTATRWIYPSSVAMGTLGVINVSNTAPAATRDEVMDSGDTIAGLRFKIFERQQAGGPLIRVPLESLLAGCTEPDVALVLFGEEHGHPVCRGLEEAVYKRMLSAERNGSVTLSLEMLDTEKQQAANMYISSEEDSSEDILFGGSLVNWQDYVNLCRLARAEHAHLLAANAPRRFTSTIATLGYESLAATISDEDRILIAPLPFQKPSPMLAAKIGPMFEGCGGRSDDEHRMHMLMAQSLWDATMAHQIQGELSRAPLANSGVSTDPSLQAQSYGFDWPQRVMHVCGRYHVEHFLGIVSHLEYYEHEARSKARVMVEDCNTEGNCAIGHEKTDPKEDYCSTEAVLADMRRQMRLIVCISSEGAMQQSDMVLAHERYLANAGDFVVICEPKKAPH